MERDIRHMIGLGGTPVARQEAWCIFRVCMCVRNLFGLGYGPFSCSRSSTRCPSEHRSCCDAAMMSRTSTRRRRYPR